MVPHPVTVQAHSGVKQAQSDSCPEAVITASDFNGEFRTRNRHGAPASARVRLCQARFYAFDRRDAPILSDESHRLGQNMNGNAFLLTGFNFFGS